MIEIGREDIASQRMVNDFFPLLLSFQIFSLAEELCYFCWKCGDHVVSAMHEQLIGLCANRHRGSVLR